jgi:hypothetical protein
MLRSPRSARLSVTPLEGRETPAVSSFSAFGAAAGGRPLVDVFDANGNNIVRFQAFDTDFTGGVRAAVGELDGNPNTLEVVAAAGPGGGPIVRVFRVDRANANAVTQVANFFAFNADFRDGLRVATGRVAGGGPAEQIIVGPDTGGGPIVRVFNLSGGTGVAAPGPLSNFFAFDPDYRGGIRVAAGEFDGNTADGDELVVGAGNGGGPRVRVLRSDGAVLADYFAFSPDFRGGVTLATAAGSNGLDRLVVEPGATDFSQRDDALNLAAASLSSNGTLASSIGTNTTGNTNTATTVTGTGVNGTVLGNTVLNNTNTSLGSAVLAANSANVLSGGLTSGMTTGITGLSSGFFPSAGTGTTGTFGTSTFGTSTFGTNTFGSSVVGAGTTGFGTNGLTTGVGVAGLGSNGFGSGGFSTTGFGTPSLGSTTGIGTPTLGSSAGFNANNLGTTVGLNTANLGTTTGFPANGLGTTTGLGVGGVTTGTTGAGTANAFPVLATPVFNGAFIGPVTFTSGTSVGSAGTVFPAGTPGTVFV